MTFKKDSKNEAKPLLSALDIDFIFEMGLKMEEGRRKYGEGNYMQCSEEDLFHFKSALLRHAFKGIQDESVDDESIESHLAATAVNAMILLKLRKKYKGGGV